MHTRRRLSFALLSIAGLLLAVNVTGCSALHHGHDGHGAAQLSLNEGKPWAIDEVARQAMGDIRDAVDAQLPAIRANSTTNAAYEQLAGSLNSSISYMVKNCKLDRQTDAMLHLVIADILTGTSAMQGTDKTLGRRDGALKIAGALNQYGRYFDHLGWRMLTLE